MEIRSSECAAGRAFMSDTDAAGLEQLATYVECDVDDVICNSGEPAEHWYRMVSGAARKFSLTTDGRRQIVEFLVTDDVFGFGADDRCAFTTEGISSGTIVARYPRRAVEARAESEPRVSRWLRDETFKSISRLEARTLMLGRVSAVARVSAFLLEWSGRCKEPADAAFSLPMSRYDIADYLALAVETVSRALTALRTHRLIAFNSRRRFSICDRRGLVLAMDAGDEALAVKASRSPRSAPTIEPKGVVEPVSYPL